MQSIFLQPIAPLLTRKTTQQIARIRLITGRRELCRGSLGSSNFDRPCVVLQFVRKGLADRLANDELNFHPELSGEPFCMLENQLPNGFPQSPFQDQVHPLQNSLHHVVFESDLIDCRD